LRGKVQKTFIAKIRALWGHHGALTYSELIQRMAELVLKKIDPAQPTKPNKSPGAREVRIQDVQISGVSAGFDLTPPPEFVTPKTRAIPKSAQRQIWQRDAGRCTHLFSNSGTRCESRFALEIDPIIPWSRGGSHEPQNLRLLCRAHHQQRTLKAAS
jgi:hypothetical protein